MNDSPIKPPDPSPARAGEAGETLARGGAAASDQPTVTGSGPPPTATPEGLPSIGGYAVIQKIGEGGMGSVFLAVDARLGRRAAIKMMRPEFAADRKYRDRFEREARAAALVESDHIVPVWQVGESPDGTPFIAMPFLRGEPLDARLRREPVAPLGVLLKVARDVTDGLSAAHEVGLIHRDIKPGNVWLEGDPAARELAQQIRRCKILDFGLARDAGGDAHLTASGAVLGTPAYMAPEQARGERVDHRADLFSLGVMLYRMATGRQPFEGPSAMAVLIALATGEPPPVRALNPEVPPAAADLIHRLLCKDPAGRPQSAGEVAAAVRQLIRDFKEALRQPGAGARGSKPGARGQLLDSLAPSPAPEAPEPEAPVLPASVELVEVEEVEVEPAPGGSRPPVERARRSRLTWAVAAGLVACGALAGGILLLGDRPKPDEAVHRGPDGESGEPKGRVSPDEPAPWPPKGKEPPAPGAKGSEMPPPKTIGVTELKSRWSVVPKTKLAWWPALDSDGRVVAVVGLGVPWGLAAFDARTGAPVRDLAGLKSNFRRLLPLEKGRFAYQNTSDNELVVWDPAAAKATPLPFRSPGGTGAAYVNVSPDGRYLAVGQSRAAPGPREPPSTRLNVTDTSTGKAVVTAEWQVGTTAFTADSSRLLVVDDTNRFRWFKLPSGAADGEWAFGRMEDALNALVVDISADGGAVLYDGRPGGKELALHLLDGRTGAVVHSFPAKRYYPAGSSVSRDGRLVALVRNDGFGTGHSVEVLTARGELLAAAKIPRGARVTASWAARLIVAYEPDTGRLTAYDLPGGP